MIRELDRRWKSLGIELNYHRWIRFQDANGIGHAEPEAFIELKDRVILFEAKLTGGPAGQAQMELLYKPLLTHIFKKPVYCLLICKNVTSETPSPRFASPEDFLRSGAPFGVWHWLGD